MLEIEAKGFDRLAALPERLGGLVKTAMLPQLALGIERVMSVLIQRLPVGATGTLRRSIQREYNLTPVFDFNAKIYTTARHAKYAEKGRKPGALPPVDALQQWAKQRGLNPWAVAQGIAQHGTRRSRTREPGEWEMTHRETPKLMAPAVEKAGQALADAIGKYLRG